MRNKQFRIYQRAIVAQVLKVGTLRCYLQEHQDHHVTAHPCGKMRRNRITLCTGDEVTLEISPYDLHAGRVIWRHER